jgi:plasmid stabilization system protein ParE
MRFNLDILPDALTDIIAAAAWYEQQREGLGKEFAYEVNRAIDSLSDNALAFRIRYRRRDVRWAYPRRFPYRVCYYIQEQTVHIFAVVHAARHDREWRKRLRT